MEAKKITLKKPVYKPNILKKYDPRAFLKDFINFSARISDDFMCAICYNLLYEPTNLACNHKFCFPCLEKWYNRESSHLQCPICQRIYPITTKFSINKDLEKDIIKQYEKEYKLLSAFKKWEFDNRAFNEIKFFYGNSYAEEEGKRKWTFFFRLKEGQTNNFIDKIVLKINSNSQGNGGQNVELTKYPFLYNHLIVGGQSIFSLLVFIHWKKSLNVAAGPTKLNYEVVLTQEGKMLSYLFKQKVWKVGEKRKK